jgi:hypothetical protein
MPDTEKADTRKKKKSRSVNPERMPPAGPHATEELTDKEKTPGSGVLPDVDDPNISPTG